MQGLVHIYTGNGKGKTSAAVGLGIRACGRGFKVLMVQFLKGTETGEAITIEKLAPMFTIHRGKSTGKFTWQMSSEEKEYEKNVQNELLDYARKAAASGQWQMVILDEIMAAIKSEMVKVEDVVSLIKDRHRDVEIVLTGRNAPNELIELADYVSEINEVKHPMNKGIAARKGIEF
ncbi:MAG TPA: cob(I)yrinic acid a,c-diamide adenosyltransferase [Clostridiaceae bacterium]|nr:cob(I)yrinic acid a,c-diamide adenosyltransferase [Clostridiaceae bacterium]